MHNYFLCVYFNSLHVSSNLRLIIRRINCVNTRSGICHSVSVTVSCAGWKVPCKCTVVSRKENLIRVKIQGPNYVKIENNEFGMRWEEPTVA